ncbi:MAG: hypothetical protein U0Q16_31625 [Bryobacteraceae bacterium]
MIARSIVASLLLCAAALGQVDIRPMPIAHVFDGASRTLSPLYGLPGATVWGDPVALPFEASRIVVRRGRALAITAANSVMASPSVSAANPGWTALFAAFEPEGAVLNAIGTRGLLFNQQFGLVQFVSGLDGTAKLSTAVPISGGWSKVAVARDSDCALLVRNEDAGAAVDRVCAGGAPVRLLATGEIDVAAICWLPGERQAAVADGAGGRLLAIDAAQPAAPVMLASAADGVRRPTAIEALSNGTIVAVQEDGPEILLLGAGRKAPFHALAAPAKPGTIEVLASGFVFGAPGANGSAFLVDLEEEQVYVVAAR